MVKLMGDIMSLHVQNKMSVDFENSAMATGKGQLSIQKKKGNAKKYSNYLTIALISYVSKIMFKMPQARRQQ